MYTSVEKGTTLLERLVHTPKDTIPSNLSMMSVAVAGGWTRLQHALVIDGQSIQCTSLQDARTSASFLAVRSLREGQLVYGGLEQLPQTVFRPFAFAVPSVVVPVWNVVFYPEAKGFWEHVTLASVEPFVFDPRLFNEEADVEVSL